MSIKSTNSVFLSRQRKTTYDVVFFLLTRFIELKYIKDFLLVLEKEKNENWRDWIDSFILFLSRNIEVSNYQLGYTTISSILVTLSIVYIHLGLEKYLVIVNIWKKKYSKQCETCYSIVPHVSNDLTILIVNTKKLYE